MQHGVGADTLLIVVVNRLARELKLEGMLTACRVIGEMAREGMDIRLAIVGEGPVRGEVEAAAALANKAAGRNAVFLTGELQDPRPAYAGADIILGMGGSALRGMAFGKPLVVQGEGGFWRLCEEHSVGYFLEAGWYGLGNGEIGDDALREALRPLLRSPDTRTKLGAFGRKLVVDRFSLESAARLQLSIYEKAVELNAATRISELVRTLHGLGRHKVRRRWERLWGTAPADDFNAIREQKKAEPQRASVSQ